MRTFKRGVTLIELLFVIAIIGVLVSLSLGAYSAATNIAREARTKAIITKIDQHIAGKYNEYRTRALPIKLPMLSDPATAGQVRLYALRELMRCELPDRKSDVLDNPVLVPLGAKQKQYRKMATATWTEQYEGSECLYLILASIRDGEDAALDWFAASETTDALARKNPPEDYDGDGMPEILDAWGKPIEFLRWPRGYVRENDCVTSVTSDSQVAPDEFDPLKRDPRWSDNDQTFAPFTLQPLIFSTRGASEMVSASYPGEPYAIRMGRGATALRYSQTSPANDPYFDLNPPVGAPLAIEHQTYLTNQK